MKRRIERRQNHNIGTHSERMILRKAQRQLRSSDAIYGTRREFLVIKGKKFPIPVASFTYVSKYNPTTELLKQIEKRKAL